jgi:hypothetical protein
MPCVVISGQAARRFTGGLTELEGERDAPRMIDAKCPRIAMPDQPIAPSPSQRFETLRPSEPLN